MNYFKTDGIRGIYPNEINEELFKNVGRSLKILGKKMIVIGYDNRMSSKSLVDAFIVGLNNTNIEIINYGLSSTPKIQFYSLKYNCLGAMITASHNNSTYNGLKLFINGIKLTKNQEELLSKEIDVIDDYNNYLLKYYTNTNLKVVIDTANGAGSLIVTKLFKDDNYHIINNDIYKEINLNCGSTNINHLAKYVLNNNYDIGFSLDGDADRVLAVSESGKVINGDMLLFLLAMYYKKENKLKNNGVVLTNMTNKGIINSFKENNIDVYISDVGDKYVYKTLNEYNLVLGSETSGHIIVTEICPYGDGILNILLIIQALRSLNITLDELYNTFDLYYELILNYKIDNFDFDFSLYNDIIYYTRKSGTEDVYRIFLQSKNKNSLEKCAMKIEEYIYINTKKKYKIQN